LISPDDLKTSVAKIDMVGHAHSPLPGTESLPLKQIIAETERRVILQALEQTEWNRTRAAQVLGISRRQLFDKIRQFGLESQG
jgi:DNA-binding NtrC family response regulator